ncbi:PepSY domain-containing protein [Chitinophaga sp. Mgbs1]|uniref:PepSY domain-containing protein n=1 Tax=Chitinophaga solisilvae TaxID=1233460 RepID=A0A3S1CX87_9BACT|nr:PepSY domain-containing protein [Chitinophaga solisilvae]
MKVGSNNTAKKRPDSRSRFYRISAWLHLWLGLVAGIIFVIVCLTGCIWVFNEEITTMLEPETRVAVQHNRPVITPSRIMEVVDKEFPGKIPGGVTFREGKTVEVYVGERRGGSILKLNPYTGEVVKKEIRKEGQTGFFRWILNGHRFLWLPYKIGRPIINYSTLVCVITLLTGLALWWPKRWNKNTRNQSFKIKWGASFKRVNYDLHNVLGFYALLILLAIGLTGMVWGIEWFSKGLYWTTSGGRTLPEYVEAKSDTTQAGKHTYTLAAAMDKAWQEVTTKHPQASGFYLTFPVKKRPEAAIAIYVYPSKGRFFDSQGYMFDQYTLSPVKANKLYEQSYQEAAFGDRLRKMNYDIHVGSILGLPGKFLAFFASLIGASLPITGAIVYFGKKKKKKKPPVVKATKAVKAEKILQH